MHVDKACSRSLGLEPRFTILDQASRARKPGAVRSRLCGGAVALLLLYATSASADPVEICLGAGADARTALAACELSRLLIPINARETARSNPRAHPALPPELRVSRYPMAFIELASARHFIELGDKAQAKAALVRALRINTGVPGAAAVQAMVNAKADQPAW